MLLTPSDVVLVRESFDRVWPVAGETTEHFYRRLFEMAPHLRPMFQGDTGEQGREFVMGTLAVVVGSLENNVQLLSVASTLAEQNAGYREHPLHYPLVGAALLWALGRALGTGWTLEVAAAWKSVFDTVSEQMIAHAHADRSSRT